MERSFMHQLEELDPMRRSNTKRIYVVSATPDGRWCIKTTHDVPWSFPTQQEAEDYAIALALRAIPSIIQVQFRDGTVQREIRYE